eukprot:7887026-Alexandrium_andersonii.AAC.1
MWGLRPFSTLANASFRAVLLLTYGVVPGFARHLQGRGQSHTGADVLGFRASEKAVSRFERAQP